MWERRRHKIDPEQLEAKAVKIDTVVEGQQMTTVDLRLIARGGP
jgi:hypothetical protein